jgi:YhcH/YjgK/YiaL family protein
MKTQFIIAFTILIMAAACNRQQNKSPEQWTENELNEWFTSGEWKQGWDVRPDETVNERELAIRYHRHPERWEKAFSFLAEENLEALEPGRYELEGSDLFVMVDEYLTKDETEARYEAHENYTDIQYVVSGEEEIGVVPIGQTEVVTPYDEERDIVFLAATQENNRIATPDRFFVFFPSDAHRPSVKTDENSPVKKIVVKVGLD